VIPGLRCELAAAPDPLWPWVMELARKLHDEGGHVAELTELPESLQRRDLVVDEPLLNRGDREIPRRGLDLRGQRLERGRRFACVHESMMDRRTDTET
jgi:hypothetical protein